MKFPKLNIDEDIYKLVKKGSRLMTKTYFDDLMLYFYTGIPVSIKDLANANTLWGRSKFEDYMVYEYLRRKKR